MTLTYTWHPSRDYLDHSNVARLMRTLSVATADELRARSVADIGAFWDTVVHDLGIEFRTSYSQVVDLTRGIEYPEWFTGGTINIVDAALGRWEEATPAATAIVHEAEDGTVRRLTFAELDDEVARVRAGLRARGIGKGDAVAIYLPMTPEAVVAAYAVASIGAMVVPLFSGFAPAAIASRLQDADAKAVITADGTTRRRRTVPLKPLLDEALTACPGRGARRRGGQRRRGRHARARPRHEVGRAAGGGPGPAGRADLGVGRAAARLHLRHDRPAEGRGAHPRRLPGQGGQRGGVRLRDGKPGGRSAGSPTWAGSWGRCRSSARMPTAARCCSTKAPRTSRTPAGCGDLVERHRVSMLGVSPTLVRTLRAAGTASGRRPVIGARAGIDGRAVGPGVLRVAGPGRLRRAGPGDQLLRRHRGRRIVPVRPIRSSRSTAARWAVRRWAWTSTSSTTTAGRCAAGSASWSAGSRGRR